MGRRIVLKKTPNKDFGLKLEESRRPPGLRVSRSPQPESLHAGDVITHVNNIHLSSLTHSERMKILKSSADGNVELVVEESAAEEDNGGPVAVFFRDLSKKFLDFFTPDASKNKKPDCHDNETSCPRPEGQVLLNLLDETKNLKDTLHVFALELQEILLAGHIFRVKWLTAEFQF
ncbi:hypothetical protein CAPTEDRAFT_193122 [Capitella teleta]|uniref:PDZ domain-containing protein n=1 Tax=Capitella teleta TaxID=283909 RepID=R7UMI9_CAPTE|nr:hypothetical protein CAPTEDRAFT_193122 [Capitella teleta]|eukprot:ELU07754.1 hypothetical protein CAPTEDRAFT_193122 [Capitella teleta]